MTRSTWEQAVADVIATGDSPLISALAREWETDENAAWENVRDGARALVEQAHAENAATGGSGMKAGQHEVDAAGWYVFDDFDVWGPYASEAEATGAGSLEAYEVLDGGPLQVVYVGETDHETLAVAVAQNIQQVTDRVLAQLPDAADMPRITDERNGSQVTS